MAKGPIVWCSRKQTAVSNSTTEAEYVAAAHCCQEMMYIKNFLKELTEETVTMTLNVDNMSTVKMIKSGQATKKSKYINIKYHFIVDELRNGWFQLKWCESKKQLADILTKPLANPTFTHLKDQLMV